MRCCGGASARWSDSSIRPWERGREKKAAIVHTGMIKLVERKEGGREVPTLPCMSSAVLGLPASSFLG